LKAHPGQVEKVKPVIATIRIKIVFFIKRILPDSRIDKNLLLLPGSIGNVALRVKRILAAMMVKQRDIPYSDPDRSVVRWDNLENDRTVTLSAVCTDQCKMIGASAAVCGIAGDLERK